MILPKGTYRARAIPSGIDFGEATTGNPQIKLPFRITDAGDYFGQTILWLVTITNDQKSADVARKGMMAAGWKGDPNNFAGLGDVECEIVIVHEFYNVRQTGEQKTSARIRFVNKIGGGFEFKKPLGEIARASLLARLGGQPVPMADGGSGSEWDGQGADPYANDDDTPF